MTQHTGTREQTSQRSDRLLPAGLRVTAGLLWLSNVSWKTPPDFGRSADGCSGLCRFVPGRFYGVDAILRRRGNLPRPLEALT
ncbi:MAG: hypothetical protein WKF51_03900 [Geodermatophilaceae bacterium]